MGNGSGGVASGSAMILIGAWLILQAIGGNLAGRIRGASGTGRILQPITGESDDLVERAIDRKNDIRKAAGLPPLTPDEVNAEIGRQNPFTDPDWVPAPK